MKKQLSLRIMAALLVVVFAMSLGAAAFASAEPSGEMRIFSVEIKIW